MSKPGQGRKILGYDRYDQPRRQDDPNALAAFDADKDDFLRGPSGRKAQSPSAPAAVFYLEKCPPVLDHKGFSSAAAAMFGAGTIPPIKIGQMNESVPPLAVVTQNLTSNVWSVLPGGGVPERVRLAGFQIIQGWRRK